MKALSGEKVPQVRKRIINQYRMECQQREFASIPGSKTQEVSELFEEEIEIAVHEQTFRLIA